MRAARAGLFLLIMGFGGVVETAWQVRERVPGGAKFGWRIFRGRYEGPSFPFEQAPQVMPLAAGSSLDVGNEFGAVRVTAGQAGEARILLRTVVFERDQETARQFASRIKLATRTEGSVLHVGTNRQDVERGQDVGDTGFETHLEIQVPEGTPLRLRNEHGETSVADVGALDLEGSYDTVDVQRVKGDAKVLVRHANASVSDVGGALELTARHGDVNAQRVTGAVRLDTQHGDAELDSNAGLVASMRHGTLQARHVGGALDVQGEHTEVNARDVAGAANVRTTYRNVELEDVKGQVTVDSQQGSVKILRVGGSAEVKAHHDRVELDAVTGPVKVVVENGSVEARGLHGGGEIQASHDSIDVDGWSGALTVAGDNASVHLATDKPLSGRLDVRTSHDGVKIELPSNGALELTANAEHGDVRVDLPGFTVTSQQSNHASGRVGSGGPVVVLQTNNGTIDVSAAEAAQ
jgi:DUF4097 and DUF4098 domain-containing protein YvlB